MREHRQSAFAIPPPIVLTPLDDMGATPPKEP